MLGPRIILLDYAIRQGDPLLHAALPAMRAVATKTGCDCLLSAIFGHQILDTHREPGTDTLALAYARGRPRPMFSGAASKVILAAQPTSWLRGLYAEHSNEIATAGMGDDWPAFRAALKCIRRDGFYISRGELEPDLSAIAVPILMGVPESAAAITLVASRERFEILHQPILVSILCEAAAQISLQQTFPESQYGMRGHRGHGVRR